MIGVVGIAYLVGIATGVLITLAATWLTASRRRVAPAGGPTGKTEG